MKPLLLAMLTIAMGCATQVGNSTPIPETVTSHCTDLDGVPEPCPAKFAETSPGAPLRGEETPGKERNPASMGSAYVPLDSWVYPVFDRLSALGYLPSAFQGMRPWTRMECARLLAEAATLDDGMADGAGRETAEMLRTLGSEFAREAASLEGARNLASEIESVYTRLTSISGPPLRDGYHFGQTKINDYGRPYGQGASAVAGISGRMQAGPLLFYMRGEYQHAPSAAAFPLGARQAIGRADITDALATDKPYPRVNRFRLLDTYAGLALKGWQVTVGKQSLWWGPSFSGPLMFSNNAAPFYLARITRTVPFTLPWIFGWMGPLRTEFIYGRLSGHHFVNQETGVITGNYLRSLADQPWIQGQKLGFKPTPNLEFGFSRTGVFGGPGMPVTLKTFACSVFCLGNVFGTQDPGDRRTGFDFSYRIPGLRRWLVLYNDAFSEDEYSPIAYPRRSAMQPGIYLPQLPKLPKLDFRAQGVYTDLPGLRDSGYYYWNLRYLGGYTNQGNILGSWVGRQGRGLHVASTYWWSARRTLQASYRQLRANREFMAGGGSMHSAKLESHIFLNQELQFSGSVQYERWEFPVLGPRRSNFGLEMQFTWLPSGAH
jgi:hypothetical protein